VRRYNFVMPQRDFYHETVKRVLIKDGWTITDDPFTLEYKGLRVYADFGAEKIVVAERGERKIIIEVKTFDAPSLVTELEKMIGQHSVYRALLKRVDPERELFVAVALDVYQDFFQRPAIQEILRDEQVRILVFNPNTEEVAQWIN